MVELFALNLFMYLAAARRTLAYTSNCPSIEIVSGRRNNASWICKAEGMVRCMQASGSSPISLLALVYYTISEEYWRISDQAALEFCGFSAIIVSLCAIAIHRRHPVKSGLQYSGIGTNIEIAAQT